MHQIGAAEMIDQSHTIFMFLTMLIQNVTCRWKNNPKTTQLYKTVNYKKTTLFEIAYLDDISNNSYPSKILEKD